jgi:hypothetical protein
MTQFPQIHLNGSHPDHLTEPLRAAIRALHDARDVLVECCPHGRDYYTINDRAISVAMAEHLARLQRIDVTIAELENIYDSVRSQADERDAIRKALR